MTTSNQKKSPANGDTPANDPPLSTGRNDDPKLAADGEIVQEHAIISNGGKVEPIHVDGVKTEWSYVKPYEVSKTRDSHIKEEEAYSSTQDHQSDHHSGHSGDLGIAEDGSNASEPLNNGSGELLKPLNGVAPARTGFGQERLAKELSIDHTLNADVSVKNKADVNIHDIPLFAPRAVRPNTPTVPQVKTEKELETNHRPHNLTIETAKANANISGPALRPLAGPRTLSTPGHVRSPELASTSDQKSSSLRPRDLSRSDSSKPRTPGGSNGAIPSPMPPSIPLPPLSLSTYLQLELSSHRPSQSYIYRSTNSEFPYESSRVKIERLLNFLFLPHQLEGVLWFGTLACLDYWLYTFTILPLRLLKSFYILGQSWSRNLASEIRFVASFVFAGSRRMWQRRRARGDSGGRQPMSRASSESKFIEDQMMRAKSRPGRHHRRMKSVPSALLPDDKANILKGLLIITTCLMLLRLDASRMYHWVRGQAAIKLYVIYNVLEVCDRLLSAIGQDVLECLFSQEALERKPDGHSKVSRPFWLFVLALCYTVIHSTALFYQVVTLNVAVNSYSNALITLLMSNQFVEIKGTVFKKFEKENLFQLTCADVVERFQLWHMLVIIASRNIVETGALNMGSSTLSRPIATAATTAFSANATQASPPQSATSILPRSFTLLPSLVSSLGSYVPAASQILSPFVIVLGSEMLIDWLKHAYINKFNNVRPVIYGRFLDILAKDYYSNAFGDQNLMRRLGLPVIPLSCLMIRASVQTYQMFVAAWVPSPSPISAASLASIHQQYSASRSETPTSTAAAIAAKVDGLLYHLPSNIANSEIPSYFTTFLILLLIYMVLLASKLILGMFLLAWSRKRYKSMKERERKEGTGHHVEGSRRIGGWGVVEVDEDKRQRIYEDDPTGIKALRDREARDNAKREQAKEKGAGVEGLEKVQRYEMAAKRIW